jgi:protein SCO1/2
MTHDEPRRIPRLGWAIAFLVATAAMAAAWSMLKSACSPESTLPPPIASAPDFSFIDQNGKPVTLQDLKGRVWVANFIFTRCPGPCPRMTSRMAEIHKAISRAGDAVQLVTVTVDPEYDTPAVLADYATRAGATDGRWSFLTGDPARIEEFVVKGMLLPLGKEADGLPAHSQRFVVVDQAGGIRSYHNLDDSELVGKVLIDIGALLREKPSAASTSGAPQTP